MYKNMYKLLIGIHRVVSSDSVLYRHVQRIVIASTCTCYVVVAVRAKAR